MPVTMQRISFTFLVLLTLNLGVSISDGQDDHFFNMKNSPGFDVAQVQDIDHPLSIEVPVTDEAGKPVFTGLYSGPYFDERRRHSNISVQVGKSAMLPCIVRQVGQNSVSWVRKKDAHILSVDSTVFISDDRFKILRPQPGSEWNLLIKPVKLSDGGLYECQISTKHKLSQEVRLKVVVPEVKIDGGPDIHAQAGSSVILKCSITDALERPLSVKWLRNGAPLSDDWRVSLVREVKPTTTSGGSRPEKMFESTVRLDRVTTEHDGHYECRPEKLGTVSVNLHVVKGGTLAAMSDDRNETSAASKMASPPIQLFLLLVLSYVLISFCHQRKCSDSSRT